LHHPNVIRYLGLHVDKKSETFMVMEFAEKGSLKTFLKIEKRNLTLDAKYELYNKDSVSMSYHSVCFPLQEECSI
jgi:serine/threonine protein kinase